MIRLVLFSILLLFCSCDKKIKEPEVLLLTGAAMTVPYKIIVEEISDEKLDELRTLIRSSFDEINDTFNKWNPNSELSHLNDLPKFESRELSNKLGAFLNQLSLIVTLTEGRFDPTIESIQKCWKEALNQNRWPDVEALSLLKSSVGWPLIHIENQQFYKERDMTSLDLGGIAKGYLVDQLVDRMRGLGLSNFYVEWGGEIKVKGEHPSGRPWRVFISNLEDSNPNNALGFIELKDGESLATSGDYLQNWTVKNADSETKLCHIIDPKTLTPLVMTEQSLCSVTVQANSCMLADALSTALMLFPTYEEALKWSFYLETLIPELKIWMTAREQIKPS